MVARWARGQVSLQDLQAAIANQDLLVRRGLATPEGRLAFLRELENYELLIQEAARRGYASRPAVIDAEHAGTVAVTLRDDFSVDPASISAEDVQHEIQREAALGAAPPWKKRSPAEVEQSARGRLASQRTAQARRALLERLYAQAKPEIHPEHLGKIVAGPVDVVDQPRGFPAAPRDPRAAATVAEDDPF